MVVIYNKLKFNLEISETLIHTLKGALSCSHSDSSQ